MDQRAAGWGFITSHARVLLAIARDPAARLRDLAAACHITERTAHRVIGDLEEAGYLTRQRHGRRTRYTPHLDRPRATQQKPTCPSGNSWHSCRPCRPPTTTRATVRDTEPSAPHRARTVHELPKARAARRSSRSPRHRMGRVTYAGLPGRGRLHRTATEPGQMSCCRLSAVRGGGAAWRCRAMRVAMNWSMEGNTLMRGVVWLIRRRR
ncbi:MarR family transcriptional regulator [Streptomyces mexicanus]|uniref:MarR family transcriptional regulator n=1 Tax=Streptomyces mexicanus TaxID=178566 RepID=UPI00366490ED